MSPQSKNRMYLSLASINQRLDFGGGEASLANIRITRMANPGTKLVVFLVLFTIGTILFCPGNVWAAAVGAFLIVASTPYSLGYWKLKPIYNSFFLILGTIALFLLWHYLKPPWGILVTVWLTNVICEIYHWRKSSANTKPQHP
jgi:hypothetical protein